MTDVVSKESVETDEAETETDDATELAARYGSSRGRFEVFEAPPIRRPPTPEQVADLDLSRAADGFDYSDLVTTHEEQDVRDAIAEMARAIAPGSAVTPLFAQRTPDGMSLVHAWFGPNFPLFRHSHPKYGDCLYYIVAGSIVMGSRVLKAGDGFFVPNGAPYKYQAGPDGVEVLEFRAGGGVPDAPGMKLHEKSVDGINRITEAAKAQQPAWVEPPATIANAYGS